MIEKLQPLKIQLGLIAILCIVLNINTIKNKYALDDEIIIIQNLNVQEGFGGIGKILTTDAFQGYLDMAGAQSPVSGGRFRPLSIISFAIEQSLFGETYGLEYRAAQKRLLNIENYGGTQSEISTQIKAVQEIKDKIKKTTMELAPLRHLIQLFLFTISMLILLFFLRKHLFQSQPILAFLTVLLFVVHPVHTEVIANIKSRDEILSLLFIILSLHFSFNYIRSKSKRDLWLLSIGFFMALLSKEYAMILPIIVVIGWQTVCKVNLKAIFNPAFFAMIFIGLIFIGIRFTFFSNVNTSSKITDVLNDPYLYATPVQAFASKMALLLAYFRVLLWPVHLSSDYSYSHFAYIGLTDWKFLLALALYIGFVIAFIYAVKKRLIITFPLAIFLGFLFMINNLIFNIGATMGERLVYHSSLGLIIIVVLLGRMLYFKISLEERQKQVLFYLFLIPVVLLFSFKTINRNSDWQSDYTLFTADVKTVANSALANNNAGTEIYNKAYETYSKIKNPTTIETEKFKMELKKAIAYFDKTIAIHERYVVAHMNRGLCYFYLENRKKAGVDWVRAAELFNGPHPFLKQNSYTFVNEGLLLGSKKEYQKAVEPLYIAAKMNPDDASIWNNLGGSYFMTGQFKLASQSFTTSLSLNSALKDAQNGKKVADAIFNLEEKLLVNPSDVATKSELQMAYQGCGVSPIYLRIKL